MRRTALMSGAGGPGGHAVREPVAEGRVIANQVRPIPGF